MKKIRESVNDPHPQLTYVARMAEKPPHFLRQWREFREMTQDDLAAAIGTSKSVISDMERGKLQLSPKWARRFAPVLKTQPGYLLDYDPNELPTDIFDIWEHIPDHDKPTARRVLEGFRRTGTDS